MIPYTVKKVGYGWEQRWEVGIKDMAGAWHVESAWNTEAKAKRRANRLNGAKE